jgi:hypothetical protein
MLGILERELGHPGEKSLRHLEEHLKSLRTSRRGEDLWRMASGRI